MPEEMTPITLDDVRWAAEDREVWVTMIQAASIHSRSTTVLVTRKEPKVWPPVRPIDVSFVLNVTRSGDVWINGQRVDLADYLMVFTGMADCVLGRAPGAVTVSLSA